jgi:cytochrome c biogenesis protein CcmG, thiol:disulfide interchange protein DsbE
MMFAVPAFLGKAPDPLLGKHAPSFVRSDLNDHRVDLSAYRGKVVLLTFWATWCAPCRIEMPHFIQWQTEYGPQGLQIIGISMDDDSGPVIAVVGEHHVNYPILMGDAPLAELYGGILGLPVTFLIDRKGNIAAHWKGETDLRHMERRVRALLRASRQ